MFTGIIQHTGRVLKREEVPDGGLRLIFGAPETADGLAQGASVCCNGVCLTAHDVTKTGFSVDIMPQSITLTTVAEWQEGDEVNLERSVKVGDELGGHMMYGHVDGVGEVVRVKQEGNSRVFTIKPTNDLMKYMSPQGSVGVNGVSLTISSVGEHVFSVSLIPETLAQTNLSRLSEGSDVNLEVDMMMKYIETLLEKRNV